MNSTAAYKVLMMARADWLTGASYRLNLFMSIARLPLTLIPVYFITGALQPLMAESIAGEGGQYFGFVVLGMAVFPLVSVAVNAFADNVQKGITSGTLESMFSTPTSTNALLAGTVAYDVAWVVVQATLVVLTGWALGMQLAWAGLAPAVVIALLIGLVHVPFGLIAAALVICYRTTASVSTVVLTASTLLGGIYYPTHVIPTWVQYVSHVLPITYGLRALRRTLLDGLPLSAVAVDIGILVLFGAVLFVFASYVLSLALRHARRAGTLGQY